jgi:RNA polymerase sigma factor (TIGR02999 family)
MASISSGQISALLLRWGQGDNHALDRLTPLVYRDLRRIAVAVRFFKSERKTHTLQPTALVHEAYLKMAKQKKVQWQNRKHFYAVAAHVMYQILVDHARERCRIKRKAVLLSLNEDFEKLLPAPEPSAELLVLDSALERLAALDLRKARVVELRFFGGLDNQQIADVLGVSANTVIRDWDFAKTWLRKEMNVESAHGTDSMGKA